MDDIFDLIQRYWWIIGIIVLRVIVPIFRKKKSADSSDSNSTNNNRGEQKKSQLQQYLEKMKAELAESEPASSQSFSREKPLPREVPFSSDDDDAAFLGHAPTPQEQQAKLIQKMQQAQKAKAASAQAAAQLADRKKALASETYQSTEKADEAIAISSLSLTNAVTKPFPENLDYLPPMQRALVFSEIFGQPKGMEE
jgi:hypothetical protein